MSKGYPAWRDQQKQKRKPVINRDSKLELREVKKNDATKETISSDKDGTVLVRKTILPDKDEPFTKATATNDKEQPTPLTLAQYIFMIPMALVYLLGRTLFDMLQGSLYRLLYCMELSAPVIDAWLFDKVTIWLPAKCNQAEIWWATKGQAQYYRYQDHFIHHTIPATVDSVDALFAYIYELGIILVALGHSISVSWQRFREKHDWQQLRQDVATILYEFVWLPSFSIGLHSYRLTLLFYHGCKHGLLSTWDDMKWIITRGIPIMLGWMAKTRGWMWMQHAWYQCQSMFMIMLVKIARVSSPVVHKLGKGVIFVGDSLALCLQSDWVQTKWKHFRIKCSGCGVWLCGEIVDFVQSISQMITAMVDHGLVPVGRVFINYVAPRLLICYEQCLSRGKMIYQRYVLPALDIMMAWFGTTLWPFYRLLERCYFVLWSFLPWWNWNGVLQTSAAIMKYSHRIMIRLMKFLRPIMTVVIYHQLPAIFGWVQWGWYTAITSLDWATIISLAEKAYQVIQEQTILLFASLERTLTNWKETQQRTDKRAEKSNKVS